MVREIVGRQFFQARLAYLPRNSTDENTAAPTPAFNLDCGQIKREIRIEIKERTSRGRDRKRRRERVIEN